SYSDYFTYPYDNILKNITPSGQVASHRMDVLARVICKRTSRRIDVKHFA
ncbi:hypothetical protein A5810_002631, partial [Enterococcus faecium]